MLLTKSSIPHKLTHDESERLWPREWNSLAADSEVVEAHRSEERNRPNGPNAA
jgi:hypothetical protein